MTPSQYHELLIGLDRALFVFHESEADMTDDDRRLQSQIAVVRSRVLRFESGHPFPFYRSAPSSDSDETLLPFDLKPPPAQ